MKTLPLLLAALLFLLAACSSEEPTAVATATIASPLAIPPTATIDLPTPLPTVTGATVTGPTVTEGVTLNPTPVDAPATVAPPTLESTPTTTNVDAPTPTATAISAALAQADGYEELTSPVSLLASYYDAINQQDYERAYSYWTAPPLDYASFATGYGDTASVQLIVQPPTRIEGAAGTLYVETPTVLIAQHHDGTTHTFAGCIVTRKSNLQPPAVPEEDVWHIYQARLEEVANNSSISLLLANGCSS